MDDEEKYRGRIMSRKDLYDGPGDQSPDHGDHDFSSEDDSNIDANSFTGEHFSTAHPQTESTYPSPIFSNNQDSLVELATANRNLLESVSKSTVDSISKAKMARAQNHIFNNMLDARMHLHRCLVDANSMPHRSLLPSCFHAATSIQDAAALSSQSLADTLGSMMEMQSRFQKTTLTRPLAPSTSPLFFPEAWRMIQERKEALMPQVYATLTKWSSRINNTSADQKKLKSMKIDVAFESQVKRVVENDWDRVVKRTRVDRSAAKRFSSLNAFMASQSISLSANEVFDDTDFYAMQLRDLMTSKHSSDASELGKQWAIIRDMQRKGSHKRTIDRKSSKGRQVRYEVHVKLHHWMAPNHHNGWHDERIDELFCRLKSF